MKTKQKTRIQKIREQYAKNAETLIAKFGANVYWDVYLDVGLALLESLYGKNTKWYCCFRNDKGFWDWFNNEFKINEDNLLKVKQIAEIDLHDFKANCLMLIAYDETHNSFYHNYLKTKTHSHVRN